MMPMHWKGLHRKSLKDNQPKTFRELSATGKLNDHLQEVAREAQETYERMQTDLKKRNPRWTPDQIERCAREVVLQDLVLVKDEMTLQAEKTGYLD